MIEWSTKFSVGNMGIDEQHKKLICIIQEVVSLINDCDNEFSNILQVLTELDDYASEHFRYEEIIMLKTHYPDAEEHIKQHDELREKVLELNIFEVKQNDKFYKDILCYLVDWLSEHIMMSDKKLGAFITQNGM